GFYLVESDEGGALFDRIRNPAETLAFCDAAFAGAALIEYSFAEPRFAPTTGHRADPSIHFRHRGGVNVAWCDGHVDRRRLSFTWSSGLYTDDPGSYEIGWFGARDDNHFFDLN
ncbi:MAG: H-X9-DG-CTERM domain-containing protein, partial [Phycisphaerae bacterium]